MAHRRLPFWSIIATALVISLIFSAGARPPTALAAPTYTVTDGADTTAGSCAVGSSTCTLRLAVQTANVNPGSTINVTSGLVIVFGATNAEIDINAAMMIQTTAAGTATIDGTNATLGVLRVVTTSPVTINRLNIQNGNNILGGGAISTSVGTALTLNNLTLAGNKCLGSNSGGAINNNGSLGLHNVAVTNNGTACSFGGGIYTNGPLIVDGGSVTGNTAVTFGGGIYIANGPGRSLTATGTLISNNTAGRGGGGAYSAAGVSLTRVKISGNTVSAGDGGGVLVTTGTATVTDSTVNGNQVTGGNGGGLSASSSQLTVTGSTLSTNQAHGSTVTGQGGGLFANSSSGFVTNSTLAGNSADSGGGGLYTGSSSLIVDSATIAANSAPAGAGVFVAATSSLSLRNSILASTASNCFGSVTSQGYNIDTANTCTLAGPGDQPNTDPNLLPLANNGGSTQTMALFATSPAINAGDPACPPPGTDQRGVARPQGSRCDIGAWEFLVSISPPAAPLPAPPPTGRQ